MKRQAGRVGAEQKSIEEGGGCEWLLVVRELATLSGLDEERLRSELSPFFKGHVGPFSLERVRGILVKYLESFSAGQGEPIVGKH
jgi:hypothetical protein